MPKKAFEEQLAALTELREAGDAAAALEPLRKVLRNRNNYMVAKAAEVAAQLTLTALVPDLLAAFDRFFDDPVKTDPQCWAKNAIVQALAELRHDSSVTFLRGLRHVQMEPVWRDREDTAGILRGNCALALVQCSDLTDHEVLSYLIEMLIDSEKIVRAEAARAIGRMARPESALLLRLRALMGDQEPEVVGACFTALLSIEGSPGIVFVRRFLDAGGEIGGEAALALGMLRSREAFEVLKERWAKDGEEPFIATLLSAVALTRQDEAVEFLIQLVEKESLSSVAAIQALASVPLTPELRSRIGAAVRASNNARLRAEFEAKIVP